MGWEWLFDKNRRFDQALSAAMLEAGRLGWWLEVDAPWNDVCDALSRKGFSLAEGGKPQPPKIAEYYRQRQKAINEKLSKAHLNGCSTGSVDTTPSELFRCPFCSAFIESSDRLCNYCGSDLGGPCEDCKYVYSRISHSKCPKCGLSVSDEGRLIARRKQEADRQLKIDRGLRATEILYENAQRVVDQAREHFKIACARRDSLKGVASPEASEDVQKAEQEVMQIKDRLDGAEQELRNYEIDLLRIRDEMRDSTRPMSDEISYQDLRLKHSGPGIIATVLGVGLVLGIAFLIFYLLWKYLSFWQFMLCMGVIVLISMALEKIGNKYGSRGRKH